MKTVFPKAMLFEKSSDIDQKNVSQVLKMTLRLIPT